MRVNNVQYLYTPKDRLLFLEGPQTTIYRASLIAVGLTASRRGVSNFVKYMYLETGSIGSHPGSGRPSKITAEVKASVEDQMQLDDETITYQLHLLLSHVAIASLSAPSSVVGRL